MTMAASDATALAVAIENLPLVDHHVHGAFRREVSPARFEQSITESDRPAAKGASTFDSQAGFAILRWCAPILDLEPHAAPALYLERRAELGAAEVNRRLLRASGVGHYLVDTGYASDDLLSVSGMADVSGQHAAEIVRLESLAEGAAADGVTAMGFADAVRARLEARIREGAVGTKSIAAYRGGLDINPARPDDASVARAASSWLRRTEHSGNLRLDHPTLTAFLWWTAIDSARPLQIHTGFGDTDLDLLRANPLLLTDFIRLAEPSGTPIILLHCYPYHREAGYLAQMFPCVYFDVGEALNYVGSRARQVVGESLELAPFAKQLFSSDAWGPAEFHLIGARIWRRAMSAVIGGWVASGDWSAESALRVAGMIGAGNATRIYHLQDS